MARLISRAEFSRMASVSDAAISKWAKGPGAEACVGKRVDISHPVAVAYLASKAVAPTPVTSPAPKAPPKPTPRRPAAPVAYEEPLEDDDAPTSDALPAGPSSLSIDDLAESIGNIEDMTLRELTDRFGTVTAFKDWLDARKKLVDIREKELKNGELEGALIEREFVKVHVFGAIEASHLRLLSDASKTIVQEVYPMVRRGDSTEHAEVKVRGIIKQILAPAKATASRVLRHDG